MKGKIALLDPVELSTTKEFPLAGGQQPFYCAASPDGQRIFAPSVFAGTVTVLSTVDGAVIRTVHAGTPLRVVLSPDPDLAYVANVSPQGDRLTVLHLHSLETNDIAGLRDANGLAFSPIIPDVLHAVVR